MKFIHLSDPHIGKSVNGFSMLDEQRRVLWQVIGYVQSERPAAVVIAGDVYDRAVPGVEAVRLFDDFLTELAAEGVAVMVVAGNHDSPERLGYAGRLLADRKLFIRGAFDGVAGRAVLSDEYGEVNFWLLPFIRPISVRGLFGDREVSTHGEAVAAAIEAAGVNYAARNVLVSHQFYTGAGAEPKRCESEINPVGGLDAVDVSIIERFDYAALGHLHGGQSVGADNCRYAGSPLKYSFSEVRHEKSVSLVELREKGNLSVSALPLVPLHDMREIKGPLSELISDRVSSLADKNDYLRVVLTDREGDITDPMGKIRSVYPNVMSLGFENAGACVDAAGTGADLERVSSMSPYELFCEFFFEANKYTMSGEQAALVRKLMDGGPADEAD
ncbi:MAG: exonuclease SbcCD subunit D [Chitinispirillales bacterium]|nr:exonuclease SbcCD subunit D [Chitinispirillales bacterium]